MYDDMKMRTRFLSGAHQGAVIDGGDGANDYSTLLECEKTMMGASISRTI